MYLIQDDTETNVTNVSDRSSNFSKRNFNYDHINYKFWIFLEGFLFIVIILGNVLTIMAIVWSRRLRRVMSNYFIFNLAVSDLLVGVMLPCHIAFYIDPTLNHNKMVCIWRFVIFNIACAGSISSLIMIALDRYIAIVYPLNYNIYATQRNMMLIIGITWIWTVGVSLIPLYWNDFDTSQRCELEILPRYYVLGMQAPLFIFNWSLMLVLYCKIWKEANMHKRRMNLNTVSSPVEINDRKTDQMVLLILGCFTFCWLPFCIMAIMQTLGFWQKQWMLICYKTWYVFAIANSGMNPIIYAWKNANFRKAFQRILHFKSPNSNLNSSFTIYLEKQRQLKKEQTNVRKDSRVNKNSNSCSPEQQSNQAEENIISSTAL